MSDVYAYTMLEGMSRPESSWFFAVVCQLDQVYMEDVYAKIAKERDKRNRTNRRGRGSR